ncbi:MAG: hypothetical protein PHO41_06430, partial [Eubacteriales bacterium]|nr:hypothetical protein [Eubacteriales bacterium]
EEALGVESFRGRLESGDKSEENITISGNLVYHARGGFCYFNWDEEADPNHMFKNVVYEDNYILFTGLADWNSRNASCSAGIDGGPNLQEGCAFRNNLFLGSRDAVVYINQLHPDTLPDFEGNEYIQYLSYPLLWLNEAGEKHRMEDAESIIRDILGDESGTYTMLHSMRWDDEYANQSETVE